jgi:hypothetical protein
MARVVFIAVGAVLMAVAGLLAGVVTVVARFVQVPHQMSVLRTWALGIGLVGFMVFCLALINWSLYHPSNIQLPFVNER